MSYANQSIMKVNYH